MSLNSNIKVLYHIPHPNTVYAGRFIYEGYRSAFKGLGCEFKTLTSNDNLKDVLSDFRPNIFISSLHIYHLKFLDLDLLRKYRKENKVFYLSCVPVWRGYSNQLGVDDLQNNKKYVQMIKKGLLGDAFYNWIEKDSPFMDGFEKETGYPFYTILLAADSFKYKPSYDEKYKADISYVGHYLPEKRTFINRCVLPLKSKYDLKLYGLDWTPYSRFLGNVARFGQYFNIAPLKDVRRLPMVDDNRVYSSSTINLNFHGDFQVEHGFDINERTYKIIACGGFELCDNVKVLRKYFTPDELVIAENDVDWFDKIAYYISNPEKRMPIIEAGMKKVLKYHTYTNRAQQMIDIYLNWLNNA